MGFRWWPDGCARVFFGPAGVLMLLEAALPLLIIRCSYC
jgi:hypothetical protein